MVDSRELFDTITTLHDNKEYRRRKTVARIRNSIQSHELDILRWIKGQNNHADALTKRKYNMWRELHKALASGNFMVNIDES